LTIVAGGGDYDFNINAYDTTKSYAYNQLLFVNDNAVLTNVDSGNLLVGIVTALPAENSNWLGMTMKY